MATAPPAPFPARQPKLLNDLEIRALVLVSLSLQVVLVVYGSRRKYIRNRLLAVALWLCYLAADAVATLALGVLSRAESNHGEASPDPRYIIRAFWAPFLLMHLGGPDTITAYALADNELWSRHLLGLVIQVGFAIYILIRSWAGANAVNCLWLVIFVAGLIKYGERTWVLYSVSKDRYRESFIQPDPGPNYAKFMAEIVSREQEGFIWSLDRKVKVVEVNLSSSRVTNIGNVLQDGTVVHQAYSLFGTFKKLFAGLVVGPQDGISSRFLFTQISWDHAFSIVEVELGLAYDLFYTKAFILYSRYGIFLRILSCLFTVATLIAFRFIHKDGVYPQTEVIITYVLLAGAISVEIYAVLILVSSEKTMIVMPTGMKKLTAVVSMLRRFHLVPSTTRWSNAMGQYNALNRCIGGKRRCTKMRDFLAKHVRWNSVSIPDDLKSLIFSKLQYRATVEDGASHRSDKFMLKQTIDFVGDGKDGEIEFDQSLFLWHMATDLCYHTERVVAESSEEGEVNLTREICKMLSDYMMHLFFVSPLMLPGGIGDIRFQDTCAEAVNFFKDEKVDVTIACRKLLEVDSRLSMSEVKGDGSKSLLFDACRLAKCLLWREAGERWDGVAGAWVDMLTYAAAECSWSYHAEKLSQGGELLTHVWLLMSHFGITDQVVVQPPTASHSIYEA